MPAARLSQLRVIRYAPDGGFSPGEWLRALQHAEFDQPLDDGAVQRLGVQITKSRAIDIVVRVELLSGLVGRLRAALGRTRSDTLFRSPARCRGQIRGAGQPLALLEGRLGDRSARLLVCAGD